MSSDVSRASQTHHVPHVGFPQKEPVQSARNVNNAYRVIDAVIGSGFEPNAVQKDEFAVLNDVAESERCAASARSQSNQIHRRGSA